MHLPLMLLHSVADILQHSIKPESYVCTKVQYTSEHCICFQGKNFKTPITTHICTLENYSLVNTCLTLMQLHQNVDIWLQIAQCLTISPWQLNLVIDLHAQTLFPPLANVVGIAVGVSIAGFVLLVVLPICVVIGCCYIKRRSSRRSPTTVTTTTQPVPPTVTVNTTNTHGQQGGFQSYPAAGTDVNQAPPQVFEMSAYPPPLQAAYLPPAHAAYTPTYPPRQA